MGKWSEETIAESRAQLGPAIKRFQEMSNEQLGVHYAELREIKDNVEHELKVVNTDIRAAEMVFAERFAEDDVRTMKFNNGMSLTISVQQSYAFEDKAAFVEWLKATGREYELSVTANSLNRIVAEYLDAAGVKDGGTYELPAGLRLGEPFTKFSCRGLK